MYTRQEKASADTDAGAGGGRFTELQGLNEWQVTERIADVEKMPVGKTGTRKKDKSVAKRGSQQSKCHLPSGKRPQPMLECCPQYR